MIRIQIEELKQPPCFRSIVLLLPFPYIIQAQATSNSEADLLRQSAEASAPDIVEEPPGVLKIVDFVLNNQICNSIDTEMKPDSIA